MEASRIIHEVASGALALRQDQARLEATIREMEK
jgi:hypothetical protein